MKVIRGFQVGVLLALLACESAGSAETGGGEAGGDGEGANGEGANGAGANGAGANGGAGNAGGSDPGLDPEASDWLFGHNSRREKYHAIYGGSYVPMKWSASLAASAQSYAEEMAVTGVWAHSDSDYGENLAWNSGEEHLDIPNVMTRWVEDEEASWGGHFTQVLWRATKYVGCGRASSSEHGSFQVCQYVTPGNCGSTSLETMMATTTPCLPECPPEGCF